MPVLMHVRMAADVIGLVRVIVRVAMRVVVRVTVIVDVIVRVRLPVAALAHVQVRRGDARSQHACDVERVIDAQAAERVVQRVERQAGIETRRQQHVAGRAGKAIEIHHPRHARASVCLIEKYLASARMMWSSRSMPRSDPAAESRRVSAMSSRLGSTSPDG
jgi:hypothetical protein